MYPSAFSFASFFSSVQNAVLIMPSLLIFVASHHQSSSSPPICSSSNLHQAKKKLPPADSIHAWFLNQVQDKISKFFSIYNSCQGFVITTQTGKSLLFNSDTQESVRFRLLLLRISHENSGSNALYIHQMFFLENSLPPAMLLNNPSQTIWNTKKYKFASPKKCNKEKGKKKKVHHMEKQRRK